MAILEVTVCDVCRNPERRTTQFHVAESGVGADLVLCDTHAIPLRELMTLVRPARAPRKPVGATEGAAPPRRKRSGFSGAVTTMEGIEKLKKND